MQNEEARKAINEARYAFYKKTCILFYQKPDDWNGAYIQFYDGGDCHSFVGKIGDDMQKVTSQEQREL